MPATVSDPIAASQGHQESLALTFQWDVGTLNWIRGVQPSGGGGAVTIADGADVAEGATTDAETASGNGSVVSILKRLRTLLAGGLPAALAAGGGLKVEGVAGGVAVPISAASLPLPSGASTEATLGTRLAEATFTARINTQGQKTSAASTPMVVASDQSPIPVDPRRSQTLLFAPIDVAGSGDNTIVGADATKKIKVASYVIVADAAVTARWKSGAATSLSGAMSLAANGGVALSGSPYSWLLETAVNQALVLNLGGAIGVRGHLMYFLET